MKFDLPKQVLWLFDQFQVNGYELYLVGGCVRDMLLGRPIHDYDGATNATPDEMVQFLNPLPCKIIATGKRHGTLTILYQGEAMEVTTYRLEQAYHNHRRPDHVIFTDDLISDLSRRDFTVNAMAYHPKRGLVDPFEGQKDLKDRTIRCVGNSKKRMEEDALRILRALRLSFELPFSIDFQCEQAIKKAASLLTYISKERIRNEWNRMLLSDTKQLLRRLRNFGVLPYIIPQISLIESLSQENPWHIYDVFTHTDVALDHSKGMNLSEKLAIVFHDFGKAQCKSFDGNHQAHFYGHAQISADIAAAILHEMKYSNKLIERVVTLIAFHDYPLEPRMKVLRRFLAKLDADYELAQAVLRVQYADDCAKDRSLAAEKLAKHAACQRLLEDMKKEEGMLRRADLAINGNDLIALGYHGKQIGEWLNRLYQIVVDDPSLNQREVLLKKVIDTNEDGNNLKSRESNKGCK